MHLGDFLRQQQASFNILNIKVLEASYICFIILVKTVMEKRLVYFPGCQISPHVIMANTFRNPKAVAEMSLFQPLLGSEVTSTDHLGLPSHKRNPLPLLRHRRRSPCCSCRCGSLTRPAVLGILIGLDVLLLKCAADASVYTRWVLPTLVALVQLGTSCLYLCWNGCARFRRTWSALRNGHTSSFFVCILLGAVGSITLMFAAPSVSALSLLLVRALAIAMDIATTHCAAPASGAESRGTATISASGKVRNAAIGGAASAPGANGRGACSCRSGIVPFIALPAAAAAAAAASMVLQAAGLAGPLQLSAINNLLPPPPASSPAPLDNGDSTLIALLSLGMALLWLLSRGLQAAALESIALRLLGVQLQDAFQEHDRLREEKAKKRAEEAEAANAARASGGGGGAGKLAAGDIVGAGGKGKGGKKEKKEKGYVPPPKHCNGLDPSSDVGVDFTLPGEVSLAVSTIAAAIGVLAPPLLAVPAQKLLWPTAAVNLAPGGASADPLSQWSALLQAGVSCAFMGKLRLLTGGPAAPGAFPALPADGNDVCMPFLAAFVGYIIVAAAASGLAGALANAAASAVKAGQLPPYFRPAYTPDVDSATSTPAAGTAGSTAAGASATKPAAPVSASAAGRVAGGTLAAASARAAPHGAPAHVPAPAAAMSRYGHGIDTAQVKRGGGGGAKSRPCRCRCSCRPLRRIIASPAAYALAFAVPALCLTLLTPAGKAAEGLELGIHGVTYLDAGAVALLALAVAAAACVRAPGARHHSSTISASTSAPVAGRPDNASRTTGSNTGNGASSSTSSSASVNLPPFLLSEGGVTVRSVLVGGVLLADNFDDGSSTPGAGGAASPAATVTSVGGEGQHLHHAHVPHAAAVPVAGAPGGAGAGAGAGAVIVPVAAAGGGGFGRSYGAGGAR